MKEGGGQSLSPDSMLWRERSDPGETSEQVCLLSVPVRSSAGQHLSHHSPQVSPHSSICSAAVLRIALQ